MVVCIGTGRARFWRLVKAASQTGQGTSMDDFRSCRNRQILKDDDVAIIAILKCAWSLDSVPATSF